MICMRELLATVVCVSTQVSLERIAGKSVPSSSVQPCPEHVEAQAETRAEKVSDQMDEQPSILLKTEAVWTSIRDRPLAEQGTTSELAETQPSNVKQSVNRPLTPGLTHSKSSGEAWVAGRTNRK